MNETTETKKVIITSKPIADSVVATADKILISLVAGTGATPLNPGNPIYEAFEYARMFHDKAQSIWPLNARKRSRNSNINRGSSKWKS